MWGYKTAGNNSKNILKNYNSITYFDTRSCNPYSPSLLCLECLACLTMKNPHRPVMKI